MMTQLTPEEEARNAEIQSLVRKLQRVTRLIDEGLNRPGDIGKQVQLFQALMKYGYSKQSVERMMRPQEKRR